jgi:hypothetical protein
MSIRTFVALSLGVVIGALAMCALALGGRGNADCPATKGAPCGNGDVNGNGTLEIGDAIYLLTYLFANGPEPLSLACPLPATGQTRCYDTWGNEVDCGDTGYPGQDGYYQAGCPVGDRFIDHDDGTVSDRCTGLMWTKTATVLRMSWSAALQHCDALEESGYDDWRLPNAIELLSLATMDTDLAALSFHPIFQFPPDLGDPFEPADFPEWRCWTSSTDLRNRAEAVFVTPVGPTALASPKTEVYRIFAVRDDR